MTDKVPPVTDTQRTSQPLTAEALHHRCAQIRLILTDVDGVLTDGRLSFDETGQEIKSFHVRDGLAIRLWLTSGRHFGIVTARHSAAVARRAAELQIPHVHQAAKNKGDVVDQILQSTQMPPEACCFIGDDLPDLRAFRRVGLRIAPCDAADELRQAADWVTVTPGGAGVVREVVQRLLDAQSAWDPLIANYQGDASDN